MSLRWRSWAFAFVAFLLAFAATYCFRTVRASYLSIRAELKETNAQLAAMKEKQTDLIVEISDIDRHLNLRTSSDAENLGNLCGALKGKYSSDHISCIINGKFTLRYTPYQQ